MHSINICLSKKSNAINYLFYMLVSHNSEKFNGIIG